MTQATEKAEKSPTAKPANPAAPPGPAAPEDARAAFQARIAAARARVNGLLAAQARAPLPDWPLPDPADEARANGETGALKFLEVVANPEVYRNCPPKVARAGLAGGIRAGLKTLAEARGAPKPDFSAEGDAPNPPEPSPREPAPEDEAAAHARWEAKVRHVAGEHRGLLPLTEEATPLDGWRHVRLPESYGPPRRTNALRPGATPDETEAELNALIAECRVLMRDVAVQSARFSCGVDDRLRFIDGACRAAEAGATLGKIVARVRSATNSGQMGENRQRIIVERVERIPTRMIAEGEGGA